MAPKPILFAALAAFTVFYVVVFARGVARSRTSDNVKPSASHIATGFGTNFFDTLGIGSFATTTAIFKFWNMVPDRLVPGTLNTGHTLPVILQAFIYIAAIEVDVLTLVLMIAGAVAGGWFGAGLVSRLSKRAVQVGMAIALLAAAVALLAAQFGLFPAGGTATELRGWRLVAGVVGNFVFAALSTLGVGLYAPSITLVSLLGMTPAAAFPIMMGSGAFLMPVASARFIWSRSWYVPVALGLTLGGLLGVPVAAFVVKSLPLAALRWLVVVIIVYAAGLMLRGSGSDKNICVQNVLIQK